MVKLSSSGGLAKAAEKGKEKERVVGSIGMSIDLGELKGRRDPPKSLDVAKVSREHWDEKGRMRVNWKRASLYLLPILFNSIP